MTRTMRVNVTKMKTKINTSRGTMTELRELRIKLVRRGKAGAVQTWDSEYLIQYRLYLRVAIDLQVR